MTSGGNATRKRKRKRELTALYEEECAQSATMPESKRIKTAINILLPEDQTAFITLLEDEYIKRCLARDSCYKISDKYLLAMVLTYFRRGRLRTEEYRTYFFPGLFLANQFEEENMFRCEIYAWALGWTASMNIDRLLKLRNKLFFRTGYRAWVDRETCDLIMAQDPDHWAWKRERKFHLSWALRRSGPECSASSCPVCTISLQSAEEKGAENIQSWTDTEEEPGTAEP